MSRECMHACKWFVAEMMKLAGRRSVLYIACVHAHVWYGRNMVPAELAADTYVTYVRAPILYLCLALRVPLALSLSLTMVQHA
jgi:hypothetical protein